MPPNIPELKTDIHSLLQERLRLSIRKTLIDILEEEVAAFLQAGKYQRSTERTDHRNETMMKYGRLNRATHKATIENLISGAIPTIQETNPYFVAILESRFQELNKKIDNLNNPTIGTHK